jgi:hypothetical protein
LSVRRPATISAFALAIVTLAACGERSFEAEQFVEEANSHGAGLELGEPLISTEPEVEVYALRVAEEEAERAEEEHAHGGGSLTVMEDGDAALAKYERCEAAATLLCYRAANVVVAFENSLPTDDRSRLDDAVRALGSD